MKMDINPKESESPKGLQEVDYRVREQIGSKLITCENCRGEGLKEPLSVKELNNIYKKAKVKVNKELSDFSKKYNIENHPIFFKEFEYKNGIGSSGGFFGDGVNSPKWFCPECEKEHHLKIEYYKEIQNLFKLTHELAYSDEVPSEIQKKFPDIAYRGWEEYEQEFSVKHKNDSFIAHVHSKKVEWYYSEEDVKAKLTQKEKEELEKQIIEFATTLNKYNHKQSDKIHDRYGWELWDAEEGVVWYRKDKLIIMLDPYEQSLSEVEVNQIKNNCWVWLDDWRLELAVDDKGSYIESIWKRKKIHKNSKKIVERSDPKYEPLVVRHLEFNPERPRDHWQSVNKEEVYKRLMEISNVDKYGGELILKFAYYEIRIYYQKHEDKLNYQYKKEGHPYSENIELRQSSALGQLTHGYSMLIDWIERYIKKCVIDTKITSVGVDSRHIVLDKREGLPLFYGYGNSEYFPEETPIRATYYTDKIVIEKRED